MRRSCSASSRSSGATSTSVAPVVCARCTAESAFGSAADPRGVCWVTGSICGEGWGRWWQEGVANLILLACLTEWCIVQEIVWTDICDGALINIGGLPAALIDRKKLWKAVGTRYGSKRVGWGLWIAQGAGMSNRGDHIIMGWDGNNKGNHVLIFDHTALAPSGLVKADPQDVIGGGTLEKRNG